MAITYAKFFPPTVLGTSLGTLYIVPAQPTTNLLRGGRIRLTNTTSAAASVRVHAVPVSGSASAGNAVLYDYSIEANGYRDVDIPLMGPGDFVQALAGTASAITAQAMGGGVFS